MHCQKLDMEVSSHAFCPTAFNLAGHTQQTACWLPSVLLGSISFPADFRKVHTFVDFVFEDFIDYCWPQAFAGSHKLPESANPNLQILFLFTELHGFTTIFGKGGIIVLNFALTFLAESDVCITLLVDFELHLHISHWRQIGYWSQQGDKSSQEPTTPPPRLPLQRLPSLPQVGTC